MADCETDYSSLKFAGIQRIKYDEGHQRVSSTVGGVKCQLFRLIRHVGLYWHPADAPLDIRNPTAFNCH
jgi:hypothetical protein